MTSDKAEVQYRAEGSTCHVSVVVGDQTVARLAILRRTMHLAGAAVTMGGIADVVTHPAHRGRGYGARLLEGAIAYMRDERYPFSLLFGISDFYHRFGYTPVLPEYAITVAARHAEGLVPSAAVPVRSAIPDDAKALLALYTQANTRRTGTLSRTVGAFDWRPRPDTEHWWGHPRRCLVAEVDDRPAGYVVLHGDPSRLRVLEIVVPASHVTTAGASLIATLAEEAVRRRLEHIRFPLPPDEPLADLLRQVGCKEEITYPANGDGMARIVDLEALAAALGPTLAPVANSLPDGARAGALQLISPEAQATIQLGEGRTARLTLPQHQLCQLAMGYRGVDAIRQEYPNAATPEDRALIRALFPAGYPHMWSIDHF